MAEPLVSEAVPNSIKKNTAPLKGVPAVVVPITSAPIDTNLCVLRGDYWEVRYKGSSSLLEDNRGLRYIAILIQHAAAAEGPLHATELVALATGSAKGPVELSFKDPVLDSVAEQQMIKRLEEIAFRRSAAESRRDYESVALFDDEADKITDELTKLHTPYAPRARRGTFSDASEKARKAVSKAIREAISKLSSFRQMQDLAEHFSKSIRKGQWLSYTGGLTWEVDFHPTQSEKKSSLRRAK